MTNRKDIAERAQSGASAREAALDIIALDDDPDFREYIESALDSLGHAARTAATGAECIALCQERLPDVLLLDIKMGEESGEEILTQLRERWPDLCVIVVTGYPSLETMRSTFKRDVFDYVEKPFSLETLRATLSQAAEALGLGLGDQDRLRVELGKRIRISRTERGWTLRDLSDASSISVSQLSSVERGAHLPSVESLLAIARALGVRPSQWFEKAGF